ncbi:MAG: DPP IV N-terminal domain-containing protein [candidate division KSB1 bacterium]|nr:DPP IV N-terminal domain-containing protein [candidate division KSB1 bacterium]
MNDSRWQMMKRVAVMAMAFVIMGCGAVNKQVKQKPLNNSSTNLTFLLQELKENPKDPFVYYKLSRVYAELDSIDYALVSLDTALVLDPKMNQAKVLRAKLLLKKNRIKEGYAEYLAVLKSETGEEYVDEIRLQLGQPFPIHQLTSGDFNNAYPYFSPDEKRIAFQSDRDGNWEIYLMSADGLQQVRLTNHPAQDEMPVFGAQDNIIAFTSTRDDSMSKGRLNKARNIYLMDLRTGTVARTAEHEADDWYPALSEKGQMLAFVSERDDLRQVPFHEKLSEIYLLQLSHSLLLRLTQNEVDDTSPSFSSDGKWILFTSNRTGRFQIYRMDTKGRMLEQLTDLAGNTGAPHLSHDGKKITFFADITGNWEIFMMDSDGKNLVQLTNDPAQDSYPSFSPDKRKIIFHSNRTGKFQLYWIDLANPLTQEDLVKRLEDKLAMMN